VTQFSSDVAVMSLLVGHCVLNLPTVSWVCWSGIA